MAEMITKIKNRIQITAAAYRQDASFSHQLAWYRMVDDLAWRLGAKRIAGYFHKKKDLWIQNYLEAKLASCIEEYANQSDAGEVVENAPIWVCWWTGEETAPPLVQQCIKSIRANAGVHPVHLICQENVDKYLNIPTHIMDRVRDKEMCLANFSDYLRFSLLAEYGGLWLDATIFCSGPIPEMCFQTPVFTCKSSAVNSRYISDYRWTSFCFGGQRGNVLFRFFKEAFAAYWSVECRAIDYLLVDYLIDIAYRRISAVRQWLDDVPVNNIHRDDLQAAMNAALPAELFEQIIKPDTCFYKLSWRERYSDIASNGEQSVYGAFVNR